MPLLDFGKSLLYNLDEEACAPPDAVDSFAMNYGFSTADLVQMNMVACEAFALFLCFSLSPSLPLNMQRAWLCNGAHTHTWL